jgi:hypothetical protein
VTLTHMGDDVQTEFLLDTGASTIVLSKQVALDLYLFSAENGRVKGIGGSVQTERAVVDAIQVGPFRMEGMPVVIVPGEMPLPRDAGDFGHEFSAAPHLSHRHERPEDSMGSKNPVDRPSIAVVGCGKLGNPLGFCLKEKGYPIVGLASRRLASTETLAAECGCSTVSERPWEATREADLVFLTVPDDAIEKVCATIVARGGIKANAAVFHCSGSQPSTIPCSGKAVRWRGGLASSPAKLCRRKVYDQPVCRNRHVRGGG